MIAIIDYDAGNIKSVEKAAQFLGKEAVVTRNRQMILAADHVILPGEKIRSYGLEEVIHEVVEQGTPFLGICLGLQLLFASSEETPGVKGLDILPGTIQRIPDAPGIKIPHIGWNSLKFPKKSRLFAGLPEEPYVYFVHSYYLKAGEESIVAATTEYGGRLIHAAVEKDNIFACQFHPEKSSDVGLQILRNFINVTRG